MRPIHMTELTPGMILARSVLNSQGKILLASGVALTEEYIRKIQLLNVGTLFIKEANYEDIEIPEYLSIKTQQRALSVVRNTIQRINREGTFSADAVYSIASDIVEELVAQPNVAIYLTGIATYDDYTLSHSLNCAIYTALLSRFCGFSIAKIKEITCGALLHDIGKIEIERTIISKPDRLTEEELVAMRQHPEKGFSLLIKKRWELSSLVAHIAWQHHERIDGSGYPRGLKGEEILSYARLLAITDVYEAITVHRPYRKAMPLEAAYSIIHTGLGSYFDETYGRIFLSKMIVYSPGMEVLLNTGERAIVVSLSHDHPRRPTIRLIAYPDGTLYLPPKEINLLEHPQISILSKCLFTSN